MEAERVLQSEQNEGHRERTEQEAFGKQQQTDAEDTETPRDSQEDSTPFLRESPYPLIEGVVEIFYRMCISNGIFRRTKRYGNACEKACSNRTP
ncbi:hypothetical protein [Halorientalis pallida]|uniref:hypothetical protein n=1 Tax=Halorientalis pallida TaxID=2479928 RepID=UPI00187D4919|nr:hypothetical protein [Halorientalis pallida]